MLCMMVYSSNGNGFGGQRKLYGKGSRLNVEVDLARKLKLSVMVAKN